MLTIWPRMVARIIAGLGVGLSTVAVPILESETLPAHNRGSLLVIQSALIIIGVAFASWICFATLFLSNSGQWRIPIACQVIFSVAILCATPWLPESPRWLAKRGETDKARGVIGRLLDKAEDSAEVQGQLNEILEALAAETEESEPSWSEVFTNSTKARNLHRVLLGMGPYMMNQWSGINSLC
jgi:MFS family permease